MDIPVEEETNDESERAEEGTTRARSTEKEPAAVGKKGARR